MEIQKYIRLVRLPIKWGDTAELAVNPALVCYVCPSGKPGTSFLKLADGEEACLEIELSFDDLCRRLENLQFEWSC